MLETIFFKTPIFETLPIVWEDYSECVNKVKVDFPESTNRWGKTIGCSIGDSCIGEKETLVWEMNTNGQ